MQPGPPARHYPSNAPMPNTHQMPDACNTLQYQSLAYCKGVVYVSRSKGANSTLNGSYSQSTGAPAGGGLARASTKGLLGFGAPKQAIQGARGAAAIAGSDFYTRFNPLSCWLHNHRLEIAL